MRISDWSSDVCSSDLYDQLQKFLPLDDSLAVLKVVHQLPDLTPALVEIDQAVAAIPEPSAQDAARAFLTVGQERLEQYRTARKRSASGNARSERAALVFNIFGDTTTKALEATHPEVQEALARESAGWGKSVYVRVDCGGRQS